MWPRTKGSSWEPPTPGGDGGFVDSIFELLLILKVFPFDYCGGCRPQVPLLGATKALLCHQALVHD